MSLHNQYLMRMDVSKMSVLLTLPVSIRDEEKNLRS